MEPAEVPGAIGVTMVFCCAPGQTDATALRLPPGANVGHAVLESGLAQRHPEVDFDTLRSAVWGISRARDHALREHDRVELLRPLKVDPKQARRLRYAAQRGPR